MDGFDLRELDDYKKVLKKLGKKEFEKQMKKHLRKEGTKYKRLVKKNAKRVKKKTGRYRKSIKRGKAYKYKKDGSIAIRVYSSARHAHLIEYGHRLKIGGREAGFVKGKNVFRDSQKVFEGQFYGDSVKWMSELMEELK